MSMTELEARDKCLGQESCETCPRYADDCDGKDIDVFWYLEEVLIKKDLDNFEWFYGGYSESEQKRIKSELEKNPDADIEICRKVECIMQLLENYKEELIGFVKNGEGVSEEMARKAVELYKQELKDSG